MVAPGRFDLIESGVRDIRIVQGSDYRLTLSFPNLFGSDWTGYAVRAQLRRDVRDAASSILATMTCSIIDPGPVMRVVQFFLTADDTELLRELRGKWDAELFNESSTQMIVQGEWALNQEVTA